MLVMLLVAGGIIIYGMFDPAQTTFFPPCPFRELTGLKCPGCGSQRAIHHLLNLNIQAALSHNVAMVLSIPYIIFGAFLDWKKPISKTWRKWRQRLYGEKAIYMVLFLILSFWVIRNI